MFKAKLIDSERYYQLRRRQLMFVMMPSVLLAFIINHYHFPVWLTALLIGAYLLVAIWAFRNQQRMHAMFGNKLLEIDDNAIRIMSKNGDQLEVIRLEDLEKIILKEEYSMPQETIREVGEEVSGKAKQNYIILQQNNQRRKLDFEMDSYFMIAQLNKAIDIWTSKGYSIERLK